MTTISLFDTERGMKFLTYAVSAIYNATTDCSRTAFAQFKQQIVNKKDGSGFQRLHLDDVLSDDERMLQSEAIAGPTSQTPKQIYIKKKPANGITSAMDSLRKKLSWRF